MDAHDNIYAPLQVPLETRTVERPALPPFYVVSLRKLVLLSIATVGLYSLYWFWRHWKLHKLDRKLDIWPVPRAIFAIFFAHGLNEEIDHRLRRAGQRHDWSPGTWATVYVVSAIIGQIINRLPDAMLAPGPSFGLAMLTVGGGTLAMVQAQRAANLACGDPTGSANARLTPLNWLWLVLGGLFWLLVLVGLALSLGDS